MPRPVRFRGYPHRLRSFTHGAGAGFNPSAFGTVELDLSAARTGDLFQDTAGATPAVANNDPVGRWNDQSGASARQAIQATAANRPLLILGAAPSGKSAIRFDGSNDVLLSSWASPVAHTGATIFLALKVISTVPNGFVFECRNNVDANPIFAIFNAGANGRVRDNAGVLIGTSAITQSTNWHVWEFYYDSNNVLDVLRDGTQVGTSAAVGVGTVSIDRWALGAAVTPGSFQSLDVGRVLHYQGALSSANRAAVRAALKSEWSTP